MLQRKLGSALLCSCLVLVLQAPAAAQLSPRAPNVAAGQGLMQCVAHALGIGKISADNAELLASNGLQHAAEPPAFLQSTRRTPYGEASYAHSPSTDGQVWTVGYDGPGSTCLVFVIGTPVEPIEARLVELFSIPNAWKPETAAEAAEGERRLQFGWDVKRPKRHLTALVSIRDLSALPTKGMVMVTISQTSQK